MAFLVDEEEKPVRYPDELFVQFERKVGFRKHLLRLGTHTGFNSDIYGSGQNYQHATNHSEAYKHICL